jgi:methanogenic corrinoid protein MtbC1
MLNNLSSVKAYMHTKFKSENACMAFMKVICRIAHEGEAHTIGGKNLLSPVQLIWLHVW